MLGRRVSGGGCESQGLSGGCAAGGDEDLVGGESEVRVAELGRELAERGWEIGAHCGNGSGGYAEWFGG